MRRFLAIVLLLAACVGCVPAQVVMPVTHKKLMVVGDSNTASSYFQYGQGDPWPVRLLATLNARTGDTWTLSNRAVGGADSSYPVSRVAGWLTADDPDVVCLMIGTNDVAGEHGATPWQSISQSEANLRDIIQTVRADGATLVLMQPPPAISKAVHDTGQTSLPYWRSRTSAEAANSLQQVKNLYIALAAEYDISLVATWDNTAALGFDGSQTDQSVQAAYLHDGVHVSGTQQGNIAAWAFVEITRLGGSK